MNRTIMFAAAFAVAAFPAFAHNHTGDADDHAAHCTIAGGEGAITAVDVEGSKVKIAHKPVETLGWSARDMEFAAAKPVDLSAFAEGDDVHFLLAAQKDKSWRVAAMCDLDADKGAHEACMNAMAATAAKLAPKEVKACAKLEASPAGHDAH